MADTEDDHVVEEPPPLPLWQEIQKRTFTNWVNLRLKPGFITDLFVDMSDGLQLIKLIEVLTERSLGRRNKRIEHVNQRLDNVAIALDFLQDKEGINLTNIGPADIVERNPKLILGLMWILFRHYTIAKALHMMPHESGQKSNDKARLLQWIRSKLPPSFPLSNLTSDWNDGFALAALVEGCVPGLNVGWRDWDPTTPLENTKKAMELAREHLGIERVIAPEDLISSDVDEISVMAYLANFPLMVEAKKSRGALNNVDRHPIAGIRTAFNVRVINPDHKATVEVQKTDASDAKPETSKVPIEMVPTNDPHVFDVSYIPPSPGSYSIALHITHPDDLDKRPPEAVLKVEAVEGPGLKGLNPHPFVGERQNLKVYNCNSHDTVRVEVIASESSRTVIPVHWNAQSREFEGVFEPGRAGHHSINVLCNSRSIKGSPFPVRVQEPPRPEFWGRGICDSLRAGEEATVFAEYPPHCTVADAQRFLSGAALTVKSGNRKLPVTEKVEGNRKTFTYIPEDVCVHEVATYFNDKLLDTHSVNAQYPSAQSRAFGPGVETGMENQNAVFVIERANNEEVQFAIEGPAPSELKRTDLGPDTAVVEYTPSAPGKYYVSVLDNHGQNVQDSPFAVTVKDQVQGFYPDKAKLSEIPSIVRVNEVVQFTADTRPAHSIVPTPELLVYDPECNKTETRVQSKQDGTYRCSFCPRTVGHYNVFATLDGVNIPPCPVSVACVDPEKVQYSGPGIDSPAFCSPNQTHFVIDAKQAGPGNVEVEMVDGEEQKVDVEVMDEKDGSYTVKYRAPKPGAYKIKVVFAGFPLPSFEINVQQPADVSGVKIDGLDNAMQPTDASKCIASGDGLHKAVIGKIAEFLVDTSEAGPGDLSFSIEGPNSSTTIVDYTPGNCSAVYSATHPGKYKLSARFGKNDDDREHIPGSPFTINADYPYDPSSITIIDPNDDGPVKRIAKGVPHYFIVDASKTAAAPVYPDGNSLSVRDEVFATEVEPRIWKVDYTLNAPSNRTVPLDVRYGNELLAIGPVVEVVDFLGENLKILGISSAGNNTLDTVIECDPRGIGKFSRLTAKVEDKNTADEPSSAVVLRRDDGLYDIVASPPKAGNYKVTLFADGHLVNEDPIEFEVMKSGTAADASLKGVPSEWVLHESHNILVEHTGDNKYPALIHNGNAEDLGVEIYSMNAIDLIENAKPGTQLSVFQVTPKKVRQYDVKMLLGDQLIKNGHLRFVPAERLRRSADLASTSNTVKFAVGEKHKDKQFKAFALTEDKQLIAYEVVSIDPKGEVLVNGHCEDPNHVVFLLGDGELLARYKVQGTMKKATTTATAYGPGLERAIVGEPATFDIICPDRGQVKVNVKGPKGVKIEMEQKMENSCTVNWTPEVPGKYEVLIYLNKSDIPAANSPFAVEALPAANDATKTSSFSFATPAEITFDCGKTVTKEHLSATVTDPNGKVTDCSVRLLSDDKIALSLKPKLEGDYKFSVLEKGKELAHSPFFVNIQALELPNPDKVHVFGDGLHHAVAGRPNEFFIDCKDAGYGSVLVALDGPADAAMSCVQMQNKCLRILYNPPIPGNYQISIGFDDRRIPGCPFNVNCVANTGRTPVPSSPRPLTDKNGNRRQKVDLNFFIPGGEVNQLQATVINPTGYKSSMNLSDLGQNYFGVQFKPTEFGQYKLHITQRGKDIPGSPFTFDAGVQVPSDADKVLLYGPGLKMAQIAVPQTFTIDTSTAGSGVVNAVIDGPEKPRTRLKDLRDGRVAVEYVANTPGHYFINAVFNGKLVRDAPFCVFVGPSKTTSKKRGSDSKPTSPVSTEPQSPKSPTQKQIVSSSTKRLANVVGSGLTRAVTGTWAEFDIVPEHQGEYTFAIEVHGPSKVKLVTENTANGIRVKFVPFAPGDYEVSIKHRGVNVGGSPYKVRAEGELLAGGDINETAVIYTRYVSHSSTTVTKYSQMPAKTAEFVETTPVIEHSAKEVNIDGLGISQFTPGKTSMFRIYNIGYKTLFVSVVTALGPCQQCSVNNCGDGSFLVSYVISDRTPGYIYIRYGDENLPGSPFKTLPTSR